MNTGGAAGISPNRANARSAARGAGSANTGTTASARTSASVCDRRSGNRCRAILLGSHLDLDLAFDRRSRGSGPAGEHRNLLGRKARRCQCRCRRVERVADATLRHPGGGGDRAVGRPALAQPADGGDRVAGEFRLAFGALAFGEQPGHTGIGEPGLPAPHRGRSHRERLGDLELGGRLDPHQRHRREPPPRGVAGVPGVGQVAVHEHPAAVVVLDDRRGRADRARVLAAPAAGAAARSSRPSSTTPRLARNSSIYY